MQIIEENTQFVIFRPDFSLPYNLKSINHRGVKHLNLLLIEKALNHFY